MFYDDVEKSQVPVEVEIGNLEIRVLSKVPLPTGYIPVNVPSERLSGVLTPVIMKMRFSKGCAGRAPAGYDVELLVANRPKEKRHEGGTFPSLALAGRRWLIPTL